MINKCHLRTSLWVLLSLALMAMLWGGGGCAASKANQLAKKQGELSSATESEGLEAGPQEPKSQVLPTLDELVTAKLGALKKRQEEQEIALAKAQQQLDLEESIEKRTFDTNAYLSLSISNSAPPLEYRLKKTEVYFDGKLVAQGGKLHHGLPPVSDLFFGPVEPGCHDIAVKATYIRLKNDLISRFRVNRIEHVEKALSFIAKSGYRVTVGIEGFETYNTVANFYRGPAIRFDKSVKPNFLPGSPIVSLNEVLKQGQVHIDFVNEDASNHRLIEKSLSIDGLPVLVDEKHDTAKEGNVVFDAPLNEGKHTLNVVLLFGEQKRVGGGPMYNFRLSFNRDFYVISGQTTLVNLTGMPRDGFRNTPHESRYARATTQILSTEYQDFFPEMTCKELVEKEQAAKRKLLEEEKKRTKLSQKKPAAIAEQLTTVALGD